MKGAKYQKSTVALVILAAGSSSRMGQPKQLLSVDGDPLIKHVVRQGLRSLCFPVIVVLGASYDQILSEIEDLPVFVARNRNWEKGLSSTIGLGLSTLEDVYPAAEAAILSVGDQPGVSSDLFNGLIGRYRKSKARIVAAKYGSTIGTPALFAKLYFDRLSSLKGDSGARAIIEQEKDQVKTLDFELGAVDLDTPEDYFRFGNP